MWTEREHAIWNEIMDWEQELTEYEGNDFQKIYSKWLETAFEAIPEDMQAAFYTQLDQILFNVHSLLQGSQFQHEAREKIITASRVFQEDIKTVSDMKKLRIDQLRYLNHQQASRHRLYSLLQGSVTGTSGFLPMSSDFLAMAVINLRSVQQTAMSYGYDVTIPFEMMTSLKVFHAAMLPNRLKADGWKQLLIDLEEREQYYFYDGNEQLADVTWFEEAWKQVMKLVAINALKGKKTSRIPLLSIAVGAGMNYQLTKKVTLFSEKYYQYRLLSEKKEETES